MIVASLIAIVSVSTCVQRSRVGMALAAMRDSETAFWTSATHPPSTSCSWSASREPSPRLAGAYYGLLQGTVPSFYFSPGLAIVYFGFAVAGGMGSIAGAVAGGLFFGALPKYLEVLWPQHLQQVRLPVLRAGRPAHHREGARRARRLGPGSGGGWRDGMSARTGSTAATLDVGPYMSIQVAAPGPARSARSSPTNGHRLGRQAVVVLE